MALATQAITKHKTSKYTSQDSTVLPKHSSINSATL